MSNHLFGVHHLPYHLEQADWDHFARMGYRSAKIFEWAWNNQQYVNNLLSAMPSDAIFLARDFPLSEQHSDVERDPVGTAHRHADDWSNKVKTGQCLLPPERTYFLGENEPHVWQYRDAAILYYAEFIRRLAVHGLRGGALNLSVGWPATIDGTPNTQPDWRPYEAVHDAIVDTGSILVLHEYGTANNHGWGYWLMRLQHCPWRDVRIVVGECGIDGAVDGGTHEGWQHSLSADGYCGWLDQYHARLSEDSRIHSAQTFTYDYSHPWDSFDIRPARANLESYPWTMFAQPPTEPEPPTSELVHPLPGAPITQHWGEHPEFYQQKLGVPYHNGVDLGAPEGTSVLAIADGKIMWVDNDPEGYGLYIRVYHPAYKFHSFIAHLSRQIVTTGQAVKQGDVLGYVGSTGMSSGPHVHFEIRLGDEGAYAQGTFGHKNGRVDPEPVFYVLNGKAL